MIPPDGEKGTAPDNPWPVAPDTTPDNPQSSAPGLVPDNPLRGLRADLHIHSVLSPCADRDMTPGNIVGMARILGLDVIAITDHQSCGNCAAAMAISDAIGGPLVIAGMEVESAEEIHLLCLFPDLQSAVSCEILIRAGMPNLPNRKDIFGEQWLMDEDDERVGEESRLLLIPCGMTCDEIASLVLERGGVCIPAHLDREANSMLVSLGAVPPDFPASFIEVSTQMEPARFMDRHPELSHYGVLVNSDAHRLETLAIAWSAGAPEDLDAPDETGEKDRNRSRITAKDIIQALRP